MIRLIVLDGLRPDMMTVEHMSYPAQLTGGVRRQIVHYRHVGQSTYLDRATLE